MMSRRSLILCIAAAMAWLACVGGAGQSAEEQAADWAESRLLRAELAQLVAERRAQVRTLDLTYEAVFSTAVYDDPNAPLGKPIWKPTEKQDVHVRYAGRKAFVDCTRCEFQKASAPGRYVCIYDGERSVLYNSYVGKVSVIPGYDSAIQGDWLHWALSWPRRPDRPPSSLGESLVRLLGPMVDPRLPTVETVHGVETVVVDCTKCRVWLDVENGGVLRRAEWSRASDGPLSTRIDVVEVCDIDGIVFPTKIVVVRFAHEAAGPRQIPRSRHVLMVAPDGLRINCELTEEDFQVELPPGTLVVDEINDTTYTVEEATVLP